MMNTTEKNVMYKYQQDYRTLIDLPMYPKGTIVRYTAEDLPSKFNSGTYRGNEKWVIVENGEARCQAPGFIQALVQWCASSQRDDCDGFIEEVE